MELPRRPGLEGSDYDAGGCPISGPAASRRPAQTDGSCRPPGGDPQVSRYPTDGRNLPVRGPGLLPHPQSKGGSVACRHAAAGSPVKLQRRQSHRLEATPGEAYETTFGSPIGQADQPTSILELKLVNPGSLCYVHVCLISLLWQATWRISLRNLGVLLRPILEAVLHHRGSLRIRSLPVLQALFDGWHDPQQQHDVAEYLSHVVGRFRPPALEGSWATRRILQEGLTVVDKGGTTTPLQLPMPGEVFLLHDAIDEWHRNGAVTALVDPPVAIHLQLERYQAHAGRIRKRSDCLCLAERVFRMPTFRDGVLTSYTVYHVMAVHIHLGPTPAHGHYRCLVWHPQYRCWYITEDGVPATRAGPAELCISERNAYVICGSRLDYCPKLA